MKHLLIVLALAACKAPASIGDCTTEATSSEDALRRCGWTPLTLWNTSGSCGIWRAVHGRPVDGAVQGLPDDLLSCPAGHRQWTVTTYRR